MRFTQGPTAARILAFGGYQPARVVTNDELAQTVDTNDEWIRSRVGVASRRIAGPEESLADMAAVAGGKALAASGLATDDIDLVIVATCTPEAPIPNIAATVASRLGIAAPGAYDLNAACAGFCYALAAASDAVRGGSATNVLVIGAEKLSQWVDWTDRSTSIIFADGAGAAVVGPVTDEQASSRPSWPPAPRTRPICGSSRQSPARSVPRRRSSPRTSLRRVILRRRRSRWRYRA
jgi:3-oxoacyl-[acyl-carrier-protein] synthase-3